ncbi:MAG: hypothetical protein KGL39_52325 [Patescibacteria group bacterium]|nr:hypothetical protein [Patescibacteria group bacterium]
MWITNNDKEAVSWWWDGEETVLEPGTSLPIAEHIARDEFGFGLDDKHSVLVRRGWVKTSADHADALKKLGAFSFTQEAPSRRGKTASGATSPAAEVSE